MRGPAGAVAPRGQRGNGRRQRRRPSQNTNGSGGGITTAAVTYYIKRGAARRAAVTGKGRRRCRWLLQKAGGRYRRPLQEAAVTGGRHRERAAAETAAVT
jgi:hypothetical protein